MLLKKILVMIVFLVQLNLLLAEINGTILMPKIFKSVH